MDLTALRGKLSSSDDDLVAFRRDLHRHPELGFAEHRTAARVAERLHRAGLEVITGVAGTGVVAVLRGDRPGRTVAWRADMDALPIDEAAHEVRSTIPNVMHACGHDGHTAIAVTVAAALAAVRRSLAGNIVFLFQPAEETFQGAEPMLATGVLDTHAIDEIYGLHLSSRLPAGRVEALGGISMAGADILEIEVHGRGGHGASPELVINPILVAAQLLVGLQQAIPATASSLLAIGQIAAGSAFNIVPDIARMTGSLRTLHATDRSELLDRLTSCVNELATQQRARAVVKILRCCPPLVNHDAHAEHVQRCARDELGDAAVVSGGPVMASDDMALFLAQRPGCYFRVGAAPTSGASAPHHSSDFAIDEAGLVAGARLAARVLVTALGD